MAQDKIHQTRFDEKKQLHEKRVTLTHTHTFAACGHEHEKKNKIPKVYNNIFRIEPIEA